MITSGTYQFEGIFTKWYAWAEKTPGPIYREGPLRWLRFQARRDERKLRAALAELP